MVGSVLAPECVILMPDPGQLFGLGDKSALITGAGSGIGQAIAATFAARGACVHVLDIDPRKARNTVDRITASGGKAAAPVCDASDDSAIAEVVKRIVGDCRIHILVNSVGMAHVGRLESTSPQDLDLIRVNVRSYYNSMHASIGHMKLNGRWCNPEYRVHCRFCGPEGPLRLCDEQGSWSSDDLLGCERLSGI